MLGGRYRGGSYRHHAIRLAKAASDDSALMQQLLNLL